MTFAVRMASASTFQWRADPLGESTGVWSAAASIEPLGSLKSLGADSGVFAKWRAGETFAVGGAWYFDAYSADDFVSGARRATEIQLGSIRPGVMKHVSVSNDGA